MMRLRSALISSGIVEAWCEHDNNEGNTGRHLGRSRWLRYQRTGSPCFGFSSSWCFAWPSLVLCLSCQCAVGGRCQHTIVVNVHRCYTLAPSVINTVSGLTLPGGSSPKCKPSGDWSGIWRVAPILVGLKACFMPGRRECSVGCNVLGQRWTSLLNVFIVHLIAA